jgi:hypothetical protein
MNLNHLPEKAYTNNENGITVEVRRGEMGYFLFTDCDMDPQLMNDSLGVSPEEAEIMLAGSMFGWGIPMVQDWIKDVENGIKEEEDHHEMVWNLQHGVHGQNMDNNTII